MIEINLARANIYVIYPSNTIKVAFFVYVVSTKVC